MGFGHPSVGGLRLGLERRVDLPQVLAPCIMLPGAFSITYAIFWL